MLLSFSPSYRFLPVSWSKFLKSHYSIEGNIYIFLFFFFFCLNWCDRCSKNTRDFIFFVVFQSSFCKKSSLTTTLCNDIPTISSSYPLFKYLMGPCSFLFLGHMSGMRFWSCMYLELARVLTGFRQKIWSSEEKMRTWSWGFALLLFLAVLVRIEAWKFSRAHHEHTERISGNKWYFKLIYPRDSLSPYSYQSDLFSFNFSIIPVFDFGIAYWLLFGSILLSSYLTAI